MTTQFERRVAAQKGVRTRRRREQKMRRAILQSQPQVQEIRSCPYCGRRTYSLTCRQHADLPELDVEEARG